VLVNRKIEGVVLKGKGGGSFARGHTVCRGSSPALKKRRKKNRNKGRRGEDGYHSLVFMAYGEREGDFGTFYGYACGA